MVSSEGECLKQLCSLTDMLGWGVGRFRVVRVDEHACQRKPLRQVVSKPEIACGSRRLAPRIHGMNRILQYIETMDGNDTNKSVCGVNQIILNLLDFRLLASIIHYL